MKSGFVMIGSPLIVLSTALLSGALVTLPQARGTTATEPDLRTEKEPLPIVFVPGTAGSELRLDDQTKTIYWVNPETFGLNPETRRQDFFLKGSLNPDGTSTGGSKTARPSR